MPSNAEVLQTPNSRVFIIEDGAAPQNAPQYMGLARAAGVNWKQGTITPVRKPSPEQYGQFTNIGTIRGAPDLPQITIESRMAPTISDLLRIVKKGCEIDVQIHIGSCQNPQDFNGGWDFIRVLEGAIPSDYSTSDMGAIDADNNAVVTETLPFSGVALFDLKKLRPTEVAATQLTDVVNRVLICDSRTCGACGIASDGCQIMFAITGPVSGSPGLPSEVLYSQDGGATWSSTNITGLALSSEATDAACVGTNLVVVSSGDNAIFYAPIVDILSGTETWTKVTSGFVSSKTPNRIVSLGTGLTWIAANGGYVYFTDDVTVGVTVQTDGGSTVQNLTGIHALDAKNIVAVGANNVVLNSTNGGYTWTLITGPAVGVALTTVFAQSPERWLVGTAGGELWFTLDSGNNWTEKAFSGSAAGTVRDIQFATRSVGYMLHDTATPRGRIMRTIDGGHSWVVMPEESGVPVPSVASLRAVAACRDDANVVLVGGTNSNGTDGYLGIYA